MTEELDLGDTVYYELKDEGSGLSIYRAVIEDEDERYQKIVWLNSMSGNELKDQILWDGKFKDGTQAGIGDYFVTLKISDTAGNERMKTAIVHVNLLSFLQEIPAFTVPQTNLQLEIIQLESLQTEITEPSTSFGGEVNTVLVDGDFVTGSFGVASSTNPITNIPLDPNILWGATAAAVLGYTLAEWEKQREEERKRKRKEAEEAEAEKRKNTEKRKDQKEAETAVRERWEQQAQAYEESEQAIEDQWIKGQREKTAQTMSQVIHTQTVKREKEREQAAFYHRMSEHEDYDVGGSKVLAVPVSQDDDSPKWWETTIDWIDQNQIIASIGIGLVVGLGAAAIIATGGLATPLVVIAGAALIAGGVTAGGTMALNAYEDRPLTQNLISNAGTAITAAVVIGLAPIVIPMGQAVIASATTTASMYAYALGASWIGSVTSIAAPVVGFGWSLWTLGSLGAIGYGASLAADPTLSEGERQDGAIIGAVGIESLDAAINVYETADLINKTSAFNVAKTWDNLQNFGTWGPNRPLDEIPGPMLPDSKLVTLPSGNLDDLPLGTSGDKSTVLLWTADERGINIIPEQTSWPTSRFSKIDTNNTILSHTNISTGAYAGGEAWHTAPNQLTISPDSGAYGYNQFRLSDSENLGALTRFDTVVNFLRTSGIDVIALPPTIYPPRP